MTFDIFDDCANTMLPDGVDEGFKRWDGSGRYHNYALLHSAVGIGDAFSLLATSEDYRDNENVIRFIDRAMREGDAVAEGHYSWTLLRISEDKPSMTARTKGSRQSDFELVWTASHLDGEFSRHVEKVVCSNQIAIGLFDGDITIFHGRQKMVLEGISSEHHIDTVQHLTDCVDTDAELWNFLGSDVQALFREALFADLDARHAISP